MNAPIEPPTGVLVIRAWLEAEPAPHLLARITRTLDIEAPPPRELVNVEASAEAVCAVVATWLAQLTAASQPVQPGPAQPASPEIRPRETDETGAP